MSQTLASMRAAVRRWLEDPLEDERINDAINDGVESLWMTLMRANLALFMGGPVSVAIPSGSQGVILVSISDPTNGPTISDVAAVSATLPAHTVYAAYTYVTESGSETLASPTTTHSCGLGLAAGVRPPTLVDGAIGWNLYASNTTTGSLVKQNDAPLEFATTNTAPFVENDTGFKADPALPGPPTENTTGDDICYIRHLEAQMPDQGFKAYDAADIGSLLMRRAGRNLATSSEYQTYYWDLINQRQLEFRPQTATSWNPRYFYIKRPRRLLYDNSQIPFLTVPCERFLRMFALSDLSVSIRETEAAAAWESKAEVERTRIELTVVQMNHTRDQYITPVL